MDAVTFWLPQAGGGLGAGGGAVMDYEAVLIQVLTLLQQEQRLSYRVLKRRLHLDDDLLEDLKERILSMPKARRGRGRESLVWVGEAAAPPAGTAPCCPLHASGGTAPAHGALL